MSKEKWLFEITPKKSLFDLNLKETWRYRDLLFMFVKRDIVTVYKQTILGPLWYLIQPLFTSIIFTLIFNNLGQIDTGEIPPFLFNLAGITAWNYFRECLNGTSTTFTKNQGLFGKVYFPRIIMPMSITISNLLKFGIQLGIFIGFYCYYVINGTLLNLNSSLLFFPVYIIMMAFLGLGFGMTISSLTTKYRDLTVLIGFGVQLLMYISAVPYPIAEAKLKFPEWVIPLVEYNPLAQIMEGVRYMLLGIGSFNLITLAYTLLLSLIVFLVGLVIFNNTEKNFIDTV